MLDVKSICIVRLSAIGDVVMMLPMVRTLQRDFPHATITWLISRPAFDLVQDIEGIEFVVIKKPRSLHDYLEIGRLFKGRSFDVLIAAQASFRSNLIYPFIRAKRKIGYDKLRAKDGQRWFVNEAILEGFDHTLEAFAKFATHLSARPMALRFDIPIKNEHLAFAHSYIKANSGPVILINPAASKPERCWLVDRYREVIRYAIANWQAQIILTGGPADWEVAFAAEIAEHLELVNLVGQTKPQQLFALMKCADVMVCPDTGPSHMASAAGLPVVALHAVTNPKISGPYTSQDTVINRYPEAILKVHSKEAATLPWGTRAHDATVMSLIESKDVIAKLKQQLSKRARP